MIAITRILSMFRRAGSWLTCAMLGSVGPVALLEALGLLAAVDARAMDRLPRAATTIVANVDGSAWAAPAAVVSPAPAAVELIALLRADAAAHELGNGVARDPASAVELWCKAAKLGDAESQFHLGWMYAYGRGVAQHDAWAAYFFQAAAAHGIAQAPAMLRLVGGAVAELPDCMRPPVVAAIVEPPVLALAAPRPELLNRAPKDIVKLVTQLAPEYQVAPQLALAIIKAESNFDAAALSRKNAMGLMQLIPETAERFNVKNAWDAKQNIRGGLAYLRWLLAYFEGDVAKVAAAYNSGEGTVERYRGVPPYDETRAYVQRIVDVVGLATQPFDSRVVGPSRLRAPRVAQK